MPMRGSPLILEHPRGDMAIGIDQAPLCLCWLLLWFDTLVPEPNG